MKGVQIGILALLVVIAALLGVIAVQQAPKHPHPHEAAVQQPVPAEEPTPAPPAPAAAPDPTPAAKPAPVSTAPRPAAPAETAQPAEAPPAEKPPQPPPEQAAPPARQPAKPLKPQVAAAPQKITLPAGYRLAVRMIDSVSTKNNRTGDAFAASLTAPLVVDGVTIAERHAQVDGRIVEADPGGRVEGRANIALELVRLYAADGRRIDIETEPFARQAESTVKRDAVKVGLLTGIGAAVGAVAGGAKGAKIGAGAGAGAGGGTVAATRGAPAAVPSETQLVFRLARPADFTAAP